MPKPTITTIHKQGFGSTEYVTLQEYQQLERAFENPEPRSSMLDTGVESALVARLKETQNRLGYSETLHKREQEFRKNGEQRIAELTERNRHLCQTLDEKDHVIATQSQNYKMQKARIEKLEAEPTPEGHIETLRLRERNLALSHELAEARGEINRWKKLHEELVQLRKDVRHKAELIAKLVGTSRGWRNKYGELLNKIGLLLGKSSVEIQATYDEKAAEAPCTDKLIVGEEAPMRHNWDGSPAPSRDGCSVGMSSSQPQVQNIPKIVHTKDYSGPCRRKQTRFPNPVL